MTVLPLSEKADKDDIRASASQSFVLDVRLLCAISPSECEGLCPPSCDLNPGTCLPLHPRVHLAHACEVPQCATSGGGQVTQSSVLHSMS